MAEKVAKVIKGVTLASLYIFSYTVLQILFGAVIALTGIDEAEIANNAGVAALFAAVAAFLIFMVTLWMRGIKRKEVFRVSHPAFSDVLLAAVMSVGFRLVTNAYMSWAEGVGPLAESIDEAMSAYDFDLITPGAMMAMVFSMFIIAPIFEEILFRGIAMTELKKVMPASVAIILQGILFGVAHMVLAQSIFACVYGVILGYVYHKTKKLSVTMFAHFVFNLSSAAELSEEQLIPAAVIGIVMTAAAVLLFALRYKPKKLQTEGF